MDSKRFNLGIKKQNLTTLKDSSTLNKKLDTIKNKDQNHDIYKKGYRS